MKKGGKHVWNYREGTWRERKLGRDRHGRNRWSFEYHQTKTRLGRAAPRGSGFPVGGRLEWEIHAKQYAVKRGPNKYDLVMRGTKTQRGFKKPRDRRWR